MLFGQSFAVLGSSLTNFGVSVQVLLDYADSDIQTTLYTMTLLASTLPAVLMGPFVGSLVDRWPRKLTLICAQLGAAICTLVIALMYWTDNFSIAGLLWVLPFSSLFALGLQVGFAASVVLIVPKEKLSRASGSLGMMMGLIQISGPLLAGILMDQIGLEMIFVINLITFAIGLATLFVITIPNPERESKGKITFVALLGDLKEAYEYMKGKPGLLGSLFLFALILFNVSSAQALFAPLVLSLGTATDLGLVRMFAGVGMVIGGLAMVIWKGPKRKMPVILSVTVFASVALMVMPVTQKIWLICAGAFMIMSIIPLASTSSQVLWQHKIDPAFHGRVFSLRGTMLKAMQPIAFLVTGVLADAFFKPGMAEGQSLANIFGSVWGVGEPRGIALMMSALGVFSFVLVMIAFFIPAIRRVDINLPDVNVKKQTVIEKPIAANPDSL
ncbi:MAG: MFS transporter [Ketobacteraceae bacterium]|nr:MFS transporter [Ketobacteraceae bacterium]